MNLKVVENELLFEGNHSIQFPFPIEKVREIGKVIVVLLDIPRHTSMPENVFGVSLDGRIIWTIQRIPELSNPLFNYSGLPDRDPEMPGTFFAYNNSSTLVTVDVNTGKILHYQMWK